MSNSYNSTSNLENGKYKITKSSTISKDISADILDVFELDKKIIDRNQLAEEINKNKYVNGKGYPDGEIRLTENKKFNIDLSKYPDILSEYKELLDKKPYDYEKRLDELNSILAERIILDTNNMIEFKYNDNFYGNKSAKEESSIAYTELNKLDQYKGKISLISKKVGRTNDYFVIKRTDEQIKKISEELKKKTENEDPKNLPQEDLDKTDNEEKDNKNDSTENKETLDPEKEELKKKLKELEEQNKNLSEENKLLKDKLADMEERLKKLEEKKEGNEDREENKESIEKFDKSLFINRDNLADDIAINRFENGKKSINNGIPQGEITLKTGVKIRLETHKDYNYFKSEYEKALANKDEKRMYQLDTEFAERLILDNPSTDDIKKRYYIQINNDMPGKNAKSEKELEEESLRCLEGLKKIGYNVEYVKYQEPTENKNREKELQEMLDEINRQQSLIDELESELNSKRLHYTETERVKKQEELKKMKKNLEKLQSDYDKLKKEIGEENKGKTFHIIRQKGERIIPEPEPNPEPEDLELNAVISDMGTDIHRERVSLETEEELRDYYKGLARWDAWNRGKLFFSRGRRRKNMIKEKMNKLAGKAFSMDASLDEKTEKSSDRHELELLNNMDKINKENSVALENPQINQLCKDYLEGKVSEDNFKILFNQHVDADANIQNVLKNAKLPEKKKITHIGTNILEKLKLQKAASNLMSAVNTEFDAYINDKQDSHIDNINKLIEDYIKEFQQNPKFLDDYKEFLQNKDPSKLKSFFQHNQAIMKMQIKNLKVKIDVLTAGKSAYQIDNKDRQKGRAYKVGNALDKLPAWAQIGGFIGLSIGTGLLTGGLGTIASAAIVTGVSAGSVGGMNALKKWTHYTKEQNTHEKNVATDYKNEQAKIAARQEQALKGKRYSRKTYKAKRQLALYDQSTQENFEISNTITDTITDLCAKLSTLTPQEENYIKKNLIQGKVRLDYYRDIGHNFLASTEKEKIERDMNRLEKAIILGSNRIGINITDISNLQATDDSGKVLTYLEIKNDLENSYNKSLIQFKRERRVLAAKYGVGTAVMSAGMSLGMQYLMGTGVFSKDPIPGSMAGLGSSEEFNLGKHELLDTGTKNNIYATSNTISSNPNITTGSEITINYGAGTDATGVIPGRLTEPVYDAKIEQVINNINGMKGLDSTIRDQLVNHIKDEPRKSGRVANSVHSGDFTNDFLHGMRCAESVEQIAKGMADSGYNHGININYNPEYDIVGSSLKNVGERAVRADFVLNNPGSGGTFRDRLVVPVPLRFNTFKDRILGKKQEDKKPPEQKDKDIKPQENDKNEKDINNPDEDKEINIDDTKDYKPKPTDPTKDPDNFYKDDFGPKKDLQGKKNIVTRGQKLDKIDKDDYGKEYPGTGELHSANETAHDILMRKKTLTAQDKDVIKKMQAEGRNYDDIMSYLENKVQSQRNQAKEKAESPKRAFNKILDECYANIPKYLEKMFGSELSQKFNQLPSSNRIHLVGEYDYLSVAGEGSSGVFRSNTGDIYVSQKAIEQFENAGDIGQIEKDGKTVRFPRIYREIKHILVHEMLHSMSVINYSDFNKGDQKILGLINTRRLGFMNINNNKATLRGRGLNEGTTESLTLSILDMRYKQEGLTDYKPAWIAYQKEQKIISKIIQTDKNNIEFKDFYKTMLLRKYSDEGEIKEATPLVELMRKMNGGKEINNSSRPYYYQLIMSLLDYVNEKNVGDIQFILDFIEKKDISILKTNLGNTLDIVFDPMLLNKNKTDFNETILNGYSSKIK